MRKHNHTTLATIAMIAAVVAFGASGAAALAVPAAQTQLPESFAATAQHTGTGPGAAAAGGGQTRVVIQITRWSTDSERDQLATVLANQGSNALADALNKQEEVGFIRFPQEQTRFPSVRLRYAREFVEGDQRIIILAADRALGWVEAIERPQRTSNSRVSLIQLNLDGDRGEGVMAVGVEMAIDPESNTLQIKNISSQPARLTRVRKSS